MGSPSSPEPQSSEVNAPGSSRRPSRPEGRFTSPVRSQKCRGRAVIRAGRCLRGVDHPAPQRLLSSSAIACPASVHRARTGLSAADFLAFGRLREEAACNDGRRVRG